MDRRYCWMHGIPFFFIRYWTNPYLPDMESTSIIRLGDYIIEDERQITLADGRKIMEQYNRHVHYKPKQILKAFKKVLPGAYVELFIDLLPDGERKEFEDVFGRYACPTSSF